MRRVVVVPRLPLGLPVSLVRRSYYEKMIKDSQQSEEGPAGMFDDFVKNPAAQKVPESLHKVNKTAIVHADQMTFSFTIFIVFFIVFVLYYIDPLREDASDRPEGIGYYNPLNDKGEERYSR